MFDPECRRFNYFVIAPATSVDPCLLRILDEIKYVPPSGSERPINACLDVLNVYGAGDFFKGQVDTPRSNEMFGTLRINIPVAHEGGQLVVYSPYSKNSKAIGSQTEPGSTAPSEVEVQNSEGNLGQRDTYMTAWEDEDSLGWIALFRTAFTKFSLSPVETDKP